MKKPKSYLKRKQQDFVCLFVCFIKEVISLRSQKSEAKSYYPKCETLQAIFVPSTKIATERLDDPLWAFDET